jgi:hypothetical protein
MEKVDPQNRAVFERLKEKGKSLPGGGMVGPRGKGGTLFFACFCSF